MSELPKEVAFGSSAFFTLRSMFARRVKQSISKDPIQKRGDEGGSFQMGTEKEANPLFRLPYCMPP